MYASLSVNDTLHLSGIHASLETGTPFTMTRESDGLVFEAVNDLDERSRKILLSGGLAAWTKKGGQ